MKKYVPKFKAVQYEYVLHQGFPIIIVALADQDAWDHFLLEYRQIIANHKTGIKVINREFSNADNLVEQAETAEDILEFAVEIMKVDFTVKLLNESDQSIDSCVPLVEKRINNDCFKFMQTFPDFDNFKRELQSRNETYCKKLRETIGKFNEMNFTDKPSMNL